jgi:hypothetical protein
MIVHFFEILCNFTCLLGGMMDGKQQHHQEEQEVLTEDGIYGNERKLGPFFLDHETYGEPAQLLWSSVVSEVFHFGEEHH